MREPIERSSATLNILLGRIIFFSVLFTLSGCSVGYRTSGEFLHGYSERHMVPYVLSQSDTDMACTMGSSLDNLLLSFQRTGAEMASIGVFSKALAAFCADQAAIEQEIIYLRALYHKDHQIAQDARIAVQRLKGTAAKRQYAAYLAANEAYVYGEKDQCPKFNSDLDELSWLLGLMSGVQAVVSDMDSGGAADVPRTIAPAVIRGSFCLDYKKWWGLPLALRAGLWAMVPALTPQGSNAWALLDEAIALGEPSGIHASSAVYHMVAESQDDKERAKKVITMVANKAANKAANKVVNKKPGGKEYEQYALLEAITRDHLLWGSDRLWVQATGTRTPTGSFGTFWQAKSADENIDDLLN